MNSSAVINVLPVEEIKSMTFIIVFIKRIFNLSVLSGVMLASPSPNKDKYVKNDADEKRKKSFRNLTDFPR
ncbi:hypothetical protein [Pantoea agglomerans]|uniref:hypothetical protein n=1 Tax=Enterobacter agglomerans TaxID=549 RepID=UPI00128EB433|nr:hypothetical protein [Pantoea agglomerans]